VRRYRKKKNKDSAAMPGFVKTAPARNRCRAGTEGGCRMRTQREEQRVGSLEREPPSLPGLRRPRHLSQQRKRRDMATKKMLRACWTRAGPNGDGLRRRSLPSNQSVQNSGGSSNLCAQKKKRVHAHLAPWRHRKERSERNQRGEKNVQTGKGGSTETKSERLAGKV